MHFFDIIELTLRCMIRAANYVACWAMQCSSYSSSNILGPAKELFLSNSLLNPISKTEVSKFSRLHAPGKSLNLHCTSHFAMHSSSPNLL